MPNNRLIPGTVDYEAARAEALTDHAAIEIANLHAENQKLRAALLRIEKPHDCGCKPCTGQCRNVEAMAIYLDEARDIARAALAAVVAGR